MPQPILLTETLIEGTTGFYSFELVDENEAPIDEGFLTSLTVTLYDVDSEQILNGRLHQDVLNVNGGLLDTDPGPPVVTTITLALLPDDTAIVNEARRVEYRVLIFEWTWDLGRRHGKHAVQFGIENLLFVP